MGKVEDALDAFKQAQELAPEIEEIRYWVGVTLMGSPSTQPEGTQIVKEIITKYPNWKSVTRSLLEKGYLQKDNPVKELL